ncbi:Alpha/Beta hydrolase protein [Infundibulicybe gibba]|nr:Alpha/Beta hydrolase protein [Infundibulicybe gibba]
MSETPFTISVSDEKLQLLRKKLELATLPDELEDSGTEYGAPLGDIRRMVARWRDGYDWRKHEAQLNAELPQFTRDIEVDGHGALNIHYVHQRGDAVDAIPLLFVHGWPGSFLEVRKLLPLLRQSSPEHPSFHIVAPSLPGYGFSAAPKKKGFGLSQYAEVSHKLMLALGYNEYVTQGGDWGYAITRRIAEVYGGKHSKAWHNNMPLAPGPHPIYRPLLLLYHLLGWYTPAEKAGFKRSIEFQQKGMGYSAMHSTKPQTLGYSLADSPVGLLAWIYEKLVNWTDGYPWEDDEVLTWISIYWFSRSGPTASLRIYYEVRMVEGPTQAFINATTPPIPAGYSRFPKELMVMPQSWLKTPRLVFESHHDSGGHFAAYERPDALAGDLRKMFGRGGPAFAVVPAKTGYD